MNTSPSTTNKDQPVKKPIDKRDEIALIAAEILRRMTPPITEDSPETQ